jgi:putative oxidoreductase
MKLAATISRNLLGLMFTVFGLNGFFHFIHQPPPASALAAQYFTVLSVSHYLVLVFAIQLISGLLLLANRFVPLALTLLAPVIVNILLFHGLMDPAGIPPGAVATILWILLFLRVRSAFCGIFQSRTPSAA